jgi:TPR repeat protein
MRRVLGRSILATAALVVSAIPAHADFYRLDGRFECLARPDAVCFDKSQAPPDPYEATPADSTHAAARPKPAPPAGATEVVQKASRPVDPILAIADRIKRDHPDPGDLAILHRAADTGDPRAVELLAWCSLRGIGTDPDPYQAYLLYGKAAALSVPHARENQRLVFERSLSSTERERILELEAAEHPASALLSDASGAPRHEP